MTTTAELDDAAAAALARAMYKAWPARMIAKAAPRLGERAARGAPRRP